MYCKLKQSLSARMHVVLRSSKVGLMAKYLLALMTLLSSGITNAGPADSPEIGRSLTVPYAQFGFDVLRDLSSEHPRDNVFISLTSIAVALAMVSNGAKGATRGAILKTLQSGAQSIDAFNADNRALVEQINKATTVQLSMASAVGAERRSGKSGFCPDSRDCI